MSELIIRNIKPWNFELENKTFILIQHADRIPPHISLIHENRYFSVSVNGVKANEETDSVFKNISIKKIKCLLLEITSIKYTTDAVAEIFLQYGSLNKPDKSCLIPITEVLNHSYGLIHESEFVYQLMDELKKNNHLMAVFGLNTEGNNFKFPIYNRKDIAFCISELNNKVRV